MKFFSANKKTGFSYDFGICPLMKKINGKYKAFCGVAKCYSAQMLNGIRSQVIEGKLTDLENRVDLITYELNTLNNRHVAKDPDTLLRGFSFGDYMPEFKEQFLQIVRGYKGRHIIISKNLWLKGDRELIKEVSEKTTLSLGFTLQLVGKFKAFLSENSDLRFSIAFTYEKASDLQKLKDTEPELFDIVDVFHDEMIHTRASRMFALDKKTGEYTKVALSMQKNHKAHMEKLASIDYEASRKQCNVYGDLKVKNCKNCNGCEVITRMAQRLKVA